MNLFCVRSSAVTVQGHALAGIALLILAFPLTTLAVAGPLLRITEAMSSSGTGGTEDWIEITNYGDAAAAVEDYKFDDSPSAFSTSNVFTGVSSIGVTESAVFFEGKTGKTVDAFKTFWRLGNGVQVGTWATGTNGASLRPSTPRRFLRSSTNRSCHKSIVEQTQWAARFTGATTRLVRWPPRAVVS